jgi:hypothetical protein
MTTSRYGRVFSLTGLSRQMDCAKQGVVDRCPCLEAGAHGARAGWCESPAEAPTSGTSPLLARTTAYRLATDPRAEWIPGFAAMTEFRQNDELGPIWCAIALAVRLSDIALRGAGGYGTEWLCIIMSPGRCFDER